MENQDDDHPSQDNIQEQETADDQQQQQQEAAATSPVRFYDCTFCKRGFSNAQALGGHMNIHRKDKAKLKQATCAASSNNPQSINISKIRGFMDPVFSIRPSVEFMGGTTTTAATAAAAAGTQWPNWILGVENDAAKMDKTQLGEVRKQPLFVERSPPPPPLKIDPPAASRSPGKDMAPSSSEEEEEEEDLDLELRLGPEPHQDSSSSATGTKKFF